MLCKIWARVFDCFYGPSVGSITVTDPGKGPGGPTPPYFWTKLRPKWPKKKFFGDQPPPLTEVLDDRSPPPLSHGLDPALNKLVNEGQLQQTPNRGDR